MATQQELNSSLPTGFVRLGLGDSITLDLNEELSFSRMGISYGPEGWGEEEGWAFDSPEREYAVRNTSPMVNINLDRVQEYNPNWRSMLPRDWLAPTPSGWLRIGRRPIAVPRLNWQGEGQWMIPGDRAWSIGDCVSFQGNYEYLVPDSSPLVQLNRERIIHLNPEYAIPDPHPTLEPQPMFTPLPDDITRPPEGYLIFSNGGLSFPQGRDWDASQFMRMEMDRGDSEWRMVHENVQPNNRANWWAVREGSPFTEGEEERIAFYNPGYVAQTPDMTPMINGMTPAEILENHNTPEGWLLMGRGDQLVTLMGRRGSYDGIRFRGDYQGARWERENNWHIGTRLEWFACRPENHFVAQHPEWIGFYNPGFGVMQAGFRPLPDGLEAVPENHFIVGRADDLPQMRSVRCALYYPANPEETKWWNNVWATGEGGSGEYWIACTVDSPLYNQERANFYNPGTTPTTIANMITSTDTTTPQPDWLPEPPEGFHVMGSMLRLRHSGGLGAGAQLVRSNEITWEAWGGTVGAGYRSDVYIALRTNHPSYNPELAALYPINNIAPRIPGPHLHTLSVNGTPISSFEELQSVAGGLMLPEEGSKVLEKLWESLEYGDPEIQIESLIEKQPVLMGVIAFHEMEKPTDILDVSAIAESTRSVGEIITRAAAGALLRGGLSNHFHYTEGGILQINPNSPPTLDQAHEIIRRTLEIRETAERLDNYSAWTLGMLGDQLENFFGDAFDVSVVMESSKKSYNTYITAVGTYRALWNEKRGNLSFTHHKEVFYAKIDAEQKDWVLNKASELSLSVADTRKLTSYVRNYGTEGLDENPPETPEALIERVEVKSVNKNYLFFLPSENKWFEYRGPFERIPNGAAPIFNADTRKRLNIDGTTQNLETWTPAGIEMPYIRGHAAIAARGREESGVPVEVEATQVTDTHEAPIEAEEEPSITERSYEEAEIAARDLAEAPEETPAPAVRRRVRRGVLSEE